VSTSPSVGSSASPIGDDPCSAVSEDLGWALGVVFRALLKTANAAADDVPGGQRGYHVLAAVARGGPGTQLALAQQLGVDRTVMTYLLDDLERAGLIERQPDPADRRARRVVITNAGHDLHATLRERMEDVDDHVLAALEPQERAVFRSALSRAAGQLAAIDPPGGACEVAALAVGDGLDGPGPGRRSKRA
jgi:DNA-binding MarR family transcriptional regulator